MIDVSEHAVLRYLERVYHVDLDAIRAEMRSPTVEKAIEFHCDTVILGNGARLKIRENTIVTVLPKRGH
jgi:uncharacterized protein related to proFAR isomerase